MNRIIMCTMAALLMLAVAGCQEKSQTLPPGPIGDDPILTAESPQDLLVNAIQETEDIAEWSGPGRVTGEKQIMQKATADTLYIYGEVTPEGYGAVVTERHSYPRGIPLITVRKSHGREGGRIVSEVHQYTSRQTFQSNDPAQSSITELYALSRDTIVTYVRRNGVLETYTFRLPVLTTTIGTTAGSTRLVSRFARAGDIVVETRDGNGTLIQTRINTGMTDGSLLTITQYPNGSWRSVRTVGRADGSVVRENRASTP